MLRRQLAVISFPRINKQYGRRVLFVDASFQLNPGEKVGPVGLRQAPGWRTPRRRPGRSRSPNTGPC